MDALAEARLELGDHDDEESRDFHVTLRGGAWCMEHYGVPYNSLRGQASNDGARVFCRLNRLNDSATFSIGVYEADGAELLSRAWCHKMQWWYDQYAEQGPRFDVSPAVVAAYPEPSGVEDLMLACGDVRIMNRIRELRAMVPRH